MTESFFTFLALAVAILGFGILTNLYRDKRSHDVPLKPNCLITRHPVVFVTGLRSLFYFRKYWNAYPVILAEHGYEVFTLHLPWSGEERKTRLQDFLNQQKHSAKKFHFVCDEASQIELSKTFEQSPSVASMTVIKSNPQENLPKAPRSFTLNLAYKLHSLRFSSANMPCAKDLGVDTPVARERLLVRMQKLGEQDFLT